MYCSRQPTSPLAFSQVILVTKYDTQTSTANELSPIKCAISENGFLRPFGLGRIDDHDQRTDDRITGCNFKDQGETIRIPPHIPLHPSSVVQERVEAAQKISFQEMTFGKFQILQLDYGTIHNSGIIVGDGARPPESYP